MENLSIEKYYNEDNTQVAALYSPGFGAGWSTWNYPEEFFMFDKGLVELALENASVEKVEEYLSSRDVECYLSGWGNIQVAWIDKDSHFYINEYDGSESIITSLDFFTA